MSKRTYFNRRQFLGKSAMAVGALSASSMKSFGENSSYEYRLRCTIEPSGVLPSWEGTDYYSSWRLGKITEISFDPQGPGDDATMTLVVAGNGPELDDTTQTFFEVKGYSRVEFVNHGWNIMWWTPFSENHLAEVESSVKVNLDSRFTPNVTVAPDPQVQKSDSDHETEALVLVTTAFTVKGGGIHHQGNGSASFSLSGLTYEGSADDKKIGPLDLGWAITLEKRAVIGGGAWQPAPAAEQLSF